MLKPHIAPLQASSSLETRRVSMFEPQICGLTPEPCDVIPSAVNPPTVTLSIGSQPFQMAVAERLQRDGALRRVLSFRAGVEIFDPDRTPISAL
jgi:hypothetical protein